MGFTNHGHATVVLDRVALFGPRHERVTVADDRRPLRGFRLGPGKSFNLVLGVAATGIPRGTSRWLVVSLRQYRGRGLRAAWPHK